VWSASGPDATKAQFWYNDTTPAGCEKVPATMSGPASGSIPNRAACFNNLPQNTDFNASAQWADNAGNLSAIVSSGALEKDTEPPKAPTVNIVTSPLNKANIAAVTINGNVPASTIVEANATVNISVTDGTSTISGSAPTDLAANYTKTFNLTALKDGTIKATACAVDQALNAGPCSETTAVKDATPPLPPIVSIDPDPITQISQTFVEGTVSGETGTEVTLAVTDENPATLDLTSPTFVLTSARTVNFNVSSLSDGIITASATLEDAFGNVSLPGTDTAIKNTTGPAIFITAPAPGSLNGSPVKVAGLASPGAEITLTDETGKKLNLEPIVACAPPGPIAKPCSDAGLWRAELRYGTSGAHTLNARTSLATGSAAVVARVTFDVDPINPNVIRTTVDGQPFLNGESVVIEGTGSDDFSGLLAFEMTVFDIRQNEVQPGPLGTPPTIRLGKSVFQGNASCPACGPKALSATWRIDLSFLPLGYYSYTVFAVDHVGNKSKQPATGSFLKGY
jgi:hypothetical protein